MNITVIGQGAIGLLWYHRLAQNLNNHVSLLCSARITSVPQATKFTDIDDNTSSKALIPANNQILRHAELILCCVKSYHVVEAIASLKNRIDVNAIVIYCHNGMVDFNQLPDLSQACYTLLTTHGSKIIQPFHVQHTGLGHNDLGLIYGSIQQKKQAQVVKALATALPSLTLSYHIKEKQWLKLAINCVINPLTAIDNIENGQLLQQKYSIIIDKLLAEIISVANKEDIIFSFDDLKNQVLDVAEKTAKNCSSMRSDILKKRKTEIDYINGYIANTAKKIGISVPEHEKLIQQVRALEVK